MISAKWRVVGRPFEAMVAAAHCRGLILRRTLVDVGLWDSNAGDDGHAGDIADSLQGVPQRALNAGTESLET